MLENNQLTFALILGSFIAISLGVVLIVGKFKNKKDRIASSHKKAKQIFTHKKFSKAEQEMTIELAKAAKNPFISIILTNRLEFNRVVDLHLRINLPHFSEHRRSNIIHDIHSIRSKIGFDKPPLLKHVTSTKEIAPITRINIQIGNKLFRSNVLDNTEEYLIVSLPQTTSEINIEANKKVTMSFLMSNDGHYQIKTKVIKALYSSHKAFIAHTYEIPPPKKRKGQRVKVYRQTTCLFSDDTSFKSGKVGKLLGIVTNISNGGMEMHAKKDIPIKSFIKTDIPTNNSDVIKNVNLKIIKKKRKNNYFVYNFKFLDVSNKVQHKINDAVQKYSLAK